VHHHSEVIGRVDIVWVGLSLTGLGCISSCRSMGHWDGQPEEPSQIHLSLLQSPHSRASPSSEHPSTSDSNPMSLGFGHRSANGKHVQSPKLRTTVTMSR